MKKGKRNLFTSIYVTWKIYRPVNILLHKFFWKSIPRPVSLALGFHKSTTSFYERKGRGIGPRFISFYILLWSDHKSKSGVAFHFQRCTRARKQSLSVAPVGRFGKLRNLGNWEIETLYWLIVMVVWGWIWRLENHGKNFYFCSCLRQWKLRLRIIFTVFWCPFQN